jgi:hypothetical protein
MNWAAASGSSIDRGSTAASAEELSIAPSAVDLSAITRERAGHAVASGASLAELKPAIPMTSNLLRILAIATVLLASSHRSRCAR